MEKVSRREFNRIFAGAFSVTTNSSLPLITLAQGNPNAKAVAAALYEREDGYFSTSNDGIELLSILLVPARSTYCA